nr:fibroblast growth factor receptor 4-like isoform X1 [Hydra vulgaris]
MLVIIRQFEYYGGFINVSIKSYTSQRAFWDVSIINNFGGFVRKISYNTSHNDYFTYNIILKYDEIKTSKLNQERKEDLKCDTYLKEVKSYNSYLSELLNNDQYQMIGFYLTFDYQSNGKNIENSMYLFSVDVFLYGLKRCQKGWVLNKVGNSCVDYDECKSLNPPCSWKNSVCINTNGSYNCSCMKGWFLDGESCLDHDECNNTNPPCPWNRGVCQNLNGSYLCTCLNGWQLGFDNVSCVDYDECNSTNPPCFWNNAVCKNLNGSYMCSCIDGWFLSHNNASCVSEQNVSQNAMLNVSGYKKIYIILAAVLAPILVVVAALVLRILKNKKTSLIFRNSNHFIYASSKEYYKVSSQEWKISYKNIILEKKIGEGAFGNVFVAKINANVLAKTKYFSNSRSSSFADCQCVIKSSDVDVAVKVLKDGANQSELNDFIEEINLMKETGYHKNIVSMIGFSSIENSLCLIVEYMENGDLLQFLRNNRSKISKKNGELASFIYTLEFQDDLEVIEKTKNEIQLMEIDLLTPNDLLRFAWQVASGMEYLSCIKLIHRDLAARNVLVGADKNLKISDFGLTRKVNNHAYIGSKTRRLPIKWMSTEAIFDHTFTSCSDVWSYGIVLFEIVTLGGTPYPTIPNCELLTLLKSGYRMNRPENCSEQMYDVMLHCWNQDPLQRPTFTELREFFDQILSDGSFYVDMNINEKNVYYNTDAFHCISAETKVQATKE